MKIRSSHLFLWVFLLSLPLFNTGCGSQGIRVESKPSGADVTLILKGQSAKKVGQTPLLLTEKEMESTKDSFQLVISSKGHNPQAILVPPTVISRSGSVFFDLEESILPIACTNQDVAISKAARGVAESLGYISQKKYDQAETLLTTLTVEFSNLSILHDLLGNVFFLQKKFDRALESYRRSAQINPGNSEVLKIIQKLEAMKSPGGST